MIKYIYIYIYTLLLDGGMTTALSCLWAWPPPRPSRRPGPRRAAPCECMVEYCASLNHVILDYDKSYVIFHMI